MAEFEALLTAKAEWKPHQIAKAGDIAALASAATTLAETVKSSLSLASAGMEVVKLLAALQNINPILMALDALADEVLKQITDLKEAGYWYLYIDPYYEPNVTPTQKYDYGFEQLRDQSGKRYWEKFDVQPGVSSGTWVKTTNTPTQAELDGGNYRALLATPRKLIAGGYNWYDPLPDPLENQSKFPSFTVKEVINEMVKAFDDEGDVPRYSKQGKVSDLPAKDATVYDIDGNPYYGWDPDKEFGLELFDLGKESESKSRWALDYVASRKAINTKVAAGKPSILGNTEFDGGSGAIAIIIAADNFDKFSSVFNEFAKMFSDIPEFSALTGKNILDSLNEIITPNDVVVKLTQVDLKYKPFAEGDIIGGKRYSSLGEIRSVNSSATTTTVMTGQKEIKTVDDLGQPLKKPDGTLIKVTEEINLNPLTDKFPNGRWVDMEVAVKPMRNIDGYNPWVPGDTVLTMEKRGSYGNSSATTAETGIDFYDNYVMVGQETTTAPKTQRIYPKIGKVLIETLQVLPDSVPPDFDGILIKDIVPGWGEFFQTLENFVKQLKGVITDSSSLIQDMIDMIAEIEEFLQYLIDIIDKFLGFFRITLPSEGVFALYIPNQSGGNEGLKKELSSAGGIPEMSYASGILFVGTEGDKLIAGGGSKNPIDLLALVLGLLN